MKILNLYWVKHILKYCHNRINMGKSGTMNMFQTYEELKANI